MVPPKKYKNTDFNADDNAETAKVANLRIHVERAFGRLKLKCRYFQRILPISSVDLIGRAFAVCAMFMNYKPPLVGSDFGINEEF